MQLIAHPHDAVPRQTGQLWQGGLVMTDYMLLFVLFIGVFFAMDPFLLYADKRTVFKHLHLVFVIPVLLLAWLAGRINREPLQGGKVLSQCWTFVLFAAWVVLGSFYARFHGKVVETFLIMGLYMFMTPLFARFIADHKSPARLLNIYLGMLFVAIAVGAVWQAGELGRWSEFHEEEFLTVPLAAFFFVRAKGTRGRFFSLVLLLALMLTVIKNTSFLVAGVTLAYLWWGFVRKDMLKKPALRRMLHYVLLVFAALAIVGTYAGIKAYKHASLPDGNPKYRLHTYEQTLEHFRDSPIWGKSFSGAGAEKFGLFTVAASTQVLPTHSDVLDILAQGGLIGIGLFCYSLWRIARYVRRRFLDRAAALLGPGLVPHFHWLAISCLAAVPVFAFNPIMLQPGKAFILWMNFGLLLGLAMRCDSGTASKKTD